MFKKLLNSKNVEKEPSTEELVERGFVPRDGKIDILFIFPPTTVAGRYGRKSIGKIGGNLIPLGIASLAAYVRDKGWGVGVLFCDQATELRLLHATRVTAKIPATGFPLNSIAMP